MSEERVVFVAAGQVLSFIGQQVVSSKVIKKGEILALHYHTIAVEGEDTTNYKVNPSKDGKEFSLQEC